MTAEIDFVVTWVDGADPNHQAKLAKYKDGFETNFNASDSLDDIRWQNDNEIWLLLKSVDLFAPWVRKVWIVTDAQTPNFEVSDDLASKIHIIDHKEIFSGYEAHLPTFNSISIETMLWRINGLAENFVYFNDDIFLTNPVSPADFFHRDGFILRGEMTSQHDADLLYDVHRMNALKCLNLQAGFANAHVTLTSQKSLFSEFFAKNPDLLEENIRHRFRHETQFSPFALTSNLAVTKGIAYRKRYKDYKMFSARVAKQGTVADFDRLLSKINRSHVIITCVNDARSISKKGIEIADFMNNQILTKPHAPSAPKRLLDRVPKKALTFNI